MGEWKEYKLGDELELIYGKGLKESEREVGNIPVYGSNGIVGYHNQALVKGPGIIIGRKGSVGEVKFSVKDFYPIDTTYYVKLKNENDIKFFYYFLSKLQLNELDSHSAVPGLNRNDVYSIDVKIPYPPEQRAIASILSSLDDKIDLLHRQNKTLEALAETLFRQWFVEEADESWEKTQIGKVLHTDLGGTPSTTNPEFWDGEIPWINSGEINEFRIVKASRFITKLGLENSSTKLMPKGTTVLAITGATLGQVSLLEIETCANQSVVGIIPNERIPKEYVFLWVKYKIEDIISNETGGAQPHINKNDVKDTEIILPPQELLKEKNKVLNNYFEKITKNTFQIRTLTQLRDALLPKLMSGEVRVK